MKFKGKNKNVIHQPKTVRVGNNCVLCLEYRPWQTTSGGTYDLGHSFSQYGPPGWRITCIYFFLAFLLNNPSESHDWHMEQTRNWDNWTFDLWRKVKPHHGQNVIECCGKNLLKSDLFSREDVRSLQKYQFWLYLCVLVFVSLGSSPHSIMILWSNLYLAAPIKRSPL